MKYWSSRMSADVSPRRKARRAASHDLDRYFGVNTYYPEEVQRKPGADRRPDYRIQRREVYGARSSDHSVYRGRWNGPRYLEGVAAGIRCCGGEGLWRQALGEVVRGAGGREGF